MNDKKPKYYFRLQLEGNQVDTAITQDLVALHNRPWEDVETHGLIVPHIQSLASIIDGFRPGELTIIAARPSMGKTDVMNNIALQAGWQGHLPIIFSLEMSKTILLNRLIATTGHYSRLKMRNPKQYFSEDQKNNWLYVLDKVNTLSLYKNETKKKEFSSFINNDGKVIGIAVNGKPFSFSLNSVLLLPEAMGPIYQNMEKYRGKRVLVIDIGSLNTSILEYNKLIPQIDRMVVSTMGINIFRSTLAETLSSHYGVTITDYDAEQILQDKCLHLNGIEQKDSYKIIQNIITDYVKSIFNYAKSRKITMTNIEIVLCGGGSILLKSYLLNEIPSATIISDAQFANALSFYQVLEAKINGKS